MIAGKTGTGRANLNPNPFSRLITAFCQSPQFIFYELILPGRNRLIDCDSKSPYLRPSLPHNPRFHLDILPDCQWQPSASGRILSDCVRRGLAQWPCLQDHPAAGTQPEKTRTTAPLTRALKHSPAALLPPYCRPTAAVRESSTRLGLPRIARL
jgi:hypothetical protein